MTRLFVFAGLLLWSVLIIIVPAGLFLVDELVQLIGIHTFVQTGGFAAPLDELAPGHSAFQLWLMRQGVNGLVPQYPSGFTLLAAPFWHFGEIKGVMALNFAASLGAILAAAGIAFRATGERAAAMAVAALLIWASFLIDYALGFWPHGVALLISTFAMYAALRALEGTGWIWAVATGLALGLGGTIRVDVWFLVPALVFWAVLVSPRPIYHLALAGVGLIPGVLFASWLNWVKFNHFFPASYGMSGGGGTDAGGHNYTLIVLVVCLVACVIARMFSPRWGGATVLLGLLLMILGLGGFDFAMNSLRGVWVLGVDLRDFHRVDFADNERIFSVPEGGVIFYFTLKKALTQSLPWLGVLPALWLFRKGRIEEKRFASLLAITLPVLMLFFASREWHGGLSNSLRYFLALVPLFAVAAIISARRLPGPPTWGWAGAIVAAVVIAAGLMSTDNVFGVRVMLEQRFPPVVFAALAAATVFAMIGPQGVRNVAGGIARTLLGAAIIMSVVTTYRGDVLTSIERRTIAAKHAEMVSKTPPNSLVYVGDFSGSWTALKLENVALASSDVRTRETATELTSIAFDAGWRVFADSPDFVEALLSVYPNLQIDVQQTEPYRAEVRPP